MNIALFEDAGYANLLPLTWLRACFELRVGRTLLIEKVRRHVAGRLARLLVRDELAAVVVERWPLESPAPDQDWCLLNGRALVSGPCSPPPVGAAWMAGGAPIAATLPAAQGAMLDVGLFHDAERLGKCLAALRPTAPPPSIRLIDYPWDAIHANPAELVREFEGGGEHVGRMYPGVHILNGAAIHIAAGARIKPGVVLDAEEGPIYIDRDVLVQPNAVIEGPCAIGAGSIIRPTAQIRAGTTIGPVCRVGGEIEGSIIQGFSNKQHSGFLGHSFVGQWVNLGADTVTSDLKNTYGTIRVFLNGRGVESGQRFVGSIIGDQAKTGIGTILPTGCVIGLAANVFTQKPVPKFVPSFGWLTDEGLARYRLDKAIEIARTVMGRRKVELSPSEAQLMERCEASARDIEAVAWGADRAP